MSDQDEIREPGQGEVVEGTIIEDISTNVVVWQHQQKQRFISDRRAQLADARAQLADARAQLEDIISDLESDYDTRDREFWQDTIKIACDIRGAIRQFKRGITSDPVCFLDIDRVVDEIGIVGTAHIYNCGSRSEKNLRERHRILEKLQSLLRRTLAAEKYIDWKEGQG